MVSGLIICSFGANDCGTNDDYLGAVQGTLISQDAANGTSTYSANYTVMSTGQFTVVAYAQIENSNTGPLITPSVDVTVNELQYPAGPYGVTSGKVIQNLSFIGFKDSDLDSDLDSMNEAEKTITLQEFYKTNDSGAKILLLNSSAGWCGPCQDEAGELQDLYTEFYAKGGRVLSTLFQDDQRQVPTTEYLRSWANYFEGQYPIAIDAQDLMYQYNPEGYIPLNVIIDTSTMVIIDVITGPDIATIRSRFSQYTQ